MPCEPIPIGSGRFATEALAEVTIFDFGALSVDYRIPFAEELPELARLSSALYDHVALVAAARARVVEIVAVLRPALTRERAPEEYEQYVVFDVAGFAPALASERAPGAAGAAPGVWRRSCAPRSAPLSESRVEDALRLHVSYAPDDLLVVDWSSAVAVGGSEDERLVLEFANVELLELRALDKRLDGDLEEANRRLHRPRRWIFGGADLRQVAKLQVDSAMLYESVSNAVSLLGDQWLADVYGRIAERYDLEKWQASVFHKLGQPREHLPEDRRRGRVAAQRAARDDHHRAGRPRGELGQPVPGRPRRAARLARRRALRRAAGSSGPVAQCAGNRGAFALRELRSRGSALRRRRPALSLQIVTLENLYGLDPARTSARQEGDDFAVRAAGLACAGQQLKRATGKATLHLRAEPAPGRLRVTIRARAPEPIRCVKLLLRDLATPLRVVEEAGEREVAAPSARSSRTRTACRRRCSSSRAGAERLGVRAEDPEVREKRFALSVERIGAARRTGRRSR